MVTPSGYNVISYQKWNVEIFFHIK